MYTYQTTSIGDNATVLRTIFTDLHSELLSIALSSTLSNSVAHQIIFDVNIECILYTQLDGFEATKDFIYGRLNELCSNYPGKNTRQQLETFETFMQSYYAPRYVNNDYKQKEIIDMMPDSSGLNEEVFQDLDIALDSTMDDLDLQRLYEITEKDKAIFKEIYLNGRRTGDIVGEFNCDYTTALSHYGKVADYLTYCLQSTIA